MAVTISRHSRPRPLLTAILAVVIAALPTPASALITYMAGDNFMFGASAYNHQHGADASPQSVESGSVASCPTSGPPLDVCVHTRAAAGIDDVGHLFLRAQAHVRRQNASPRPPGQTSANANAFTEIVVFALDGYVGMAPAANFYFGLAGTIVDAKSDAMVTTQAFAFSQLFAGNGSGFQCDNLASPCSPDAVTTLRVTDYMPSAGFRVRLTSEVSIGAPAGFGGYNAETNVDYYDTMTLLAIQLLDASDQPIPNVHLTFTDVDGNTFEMPDTPPSPTPTPTGATPTPTPTATPGGPTTTPTSTPSCTSPPCEDCENCIDDDNDGLVDRADPDCAPRANGGGAGLPVGNDVKALDKCAKAIRKGGAKIASVRLTQLQSCLKAVTDCVQLKASNGACVQAAQAKCAKIKAALPAAETTIMAAFTKACADPPVSAASLDATNGLGYAAEMVPCGYRGVAGVGSNLSLAECVRRQQACAAERLLAFSVPRAGELLGLGGFELANDLPCLVGLADGLDGGIGEAKAKALRKCDAAIQKAADKLASGRRKAVETCDAAVFTCAQTKPGDDKCTMKAHDTCTKSLAGIPKLESSFAATLTKACEPVDITDLRLDTGLGFAGLDSICAALGAPAPTSIAGIATCLEQELSCRVDQMLDNATPRNHELQSIGTAP